MVAWLRSLARFAIMILLVPRMVAWVFAALSIPLGVLALMHITGIHWLIALIIYGALFYYPSTKPIRIIAPLLGLYFLVDAGFDLKRAAYPYSQMGEQMEVERPTIDYTRMSDADFAGYKQEILLPSTVQNCINNAMRQVNGKITPQQGIYCACYSQKMVQRITRADLNKLARKPGFEPFDNAERQSIAAECQKTP